MGSLDQFAENQTLALLRAGPSPVRLAELTLKIGLRADSEMKLAQINGPAVACRAGCSHCCHHQFVTAIVPEVLRLAATIRATYSEERLAGLQERIAAYLEIVRATPGPERLSTVKATCPILEEELCGAFEARPLACRRHNSVDVEACIRYRSGERKVPALANNEQIRVGQSLLSGWALGLRRLRLQEAIVELVPALDIALRNPDADERYLAGEPLFDSVVVAGYDPGPIRRALKARSGLGVPLD